MIDLPALRGISQSPRVGNVRRALRRGYFRRSKPNHFFKAFSFGRRVVVLVLVVPDDVFVRGKRSRTRRRRRRGKQRSRRRRRRSWRRRDSF